MSYRHRTLAGAIFVALSAAALPSHAQPLPGARCASDPPGTDITTQVSNGILRCQLRPVAPAVCAIPPHVVYDRNNGPDLCRPSAPPAPGVPPSTAPQCPPGMQLQVDGGAGNLDRCRGPITWVMPITGMF